MREALPQGLGLVLLDGWRSYAFQNELFDYYSMRSSRDIAGYVADPDSMELIPGHVTGGAVDLTLAHHGRPLAIGSDYDEFSDEAHLLSLEGHLPLSREGVWRRYLGTLLGDAGFAPYPLEWWHWS